jgi:hypothetical protein
LKGVIHPEEQSEYAFVAKNKDTNVKASTLLINALSDKVFRQVGEKSMVIVVERFITRNL